MNKEQEQIIDEAYENYTQTKIIKTDSGETHISPIGHYNGMTKEQFINRIKTDKEFSEKWGLKIEERELRNKERVKLSWFIFNPNEEEKNAPEWWNIKKLTMDEHNIPTKLITITYNNETIENYE